MSYLLVRSKFADYAKFRAVFDEHVGTRKASGSKGGYVFRNADDPNEVLVLLEWDDLAKARTFSQSDDLRARMQEAGAADRPDIYYLDEAGRPSA